ncbi:Orotate phosphoribosyltransferase [uncultured archaeon]|nr:Orotate phosphoribosyltransferase [uncultured archaeon]
MENSKLVAEILVGIKAVKFRLDPPFTYKSGIKSPVYTDCRLLMSYPTERQVVVDALADVIAEELRVESIARLGGTATAGIPHTAWVAQQLELPMLYVRPKQKDHGTESKVEGVLNKGDRVVVIEDLVSTGGSCLDTVNVIREAGGIVDDVVSIYTYRMPEAEEAFKNANVKLHPLTDFQATIDAAQKAGHLKQDEASIARLWQRDPHTWDSTKK